MNNTPENLLDEAYGRWSLLLERLRTPFDENIFNEIIFAYSEDHREYHNLTHILSCLREFNDIGQHADNRYAIELALWYHDIVCTPYAIDNESNSVEKAKEHLLHMGLLEEYGDLVEKYILVTTHTSSPFSKDEKLIADTDLAILGKQPHVFDKYEQQILSEYEQGGENIFDLEVFRKGRRELLKRFLSRPSIYHTLIFRSEYEDQARKNIERAIAKLQKPS